MTDPTPLSSKQREIVEEIATEQARTCRFCGSKEWDAPFVAEASTGSWTFVVNCARCGGTTETIQVSREDAASRLDLHSGRHQKPRRGTSGAEG